MMMKHGSLALALCCAMALPAAANAQSIGQQEYLDSCAQCHGSSGMGDGPLAGYLNASLPDLTMVQANNGGVFPVTDVFRLIDGSGTSGVHGTSDMPAWGSRFQTRGALVANPDFQEEEAKTYAQFRILALVEYLSSIQQQE
jgi:mono/diheme cytochrome c family protein